MRAAGRFAALLAVSSLCAPASAQVMGTAYVEVGGALCAAIRAELSAIGVPVTESAASATWSVECGDEVLLHGPEGSVARARDEQNAGFASEVAEYVRAQLLVPPVVSPAPALAAGELTPPPPPSPNVEDAAVEAAPRVESSSRETAEPAEVDPVSSLDSGVRFTLSVFVGGLLSGDVGFPALTIAAEPRVYFGDLGVGVRVGTSVASPVINPLAGVVFPEEPPPFEMRVRSRFLDLGLDVMYAPQVAATPLRLGVGAGIAAVRIQLSGEGGDEFGLQNESSAAWTAFPYARGGAMFRVHERVQVRLEGRLGWLAREVASSVPFAPVPTTVAQGVMGELNLGLEVFIR